VRRVWTGPTLVRGTTNMKAEACWRSGAYDPSSSKGLRSLSARSRLPHWVTLCSVPAQAATSCALHHPQNVERLLKRNGAAVRVACTRRQPRTPGRCTARCPLAGQVQGLPVRMAIHTGACGTATAPASAFLERRSSAWPSRRPKSLTSRKLWQVTGRRRCGGLPRLCTKRADASWRAAAGLARAQAAWEPGRAVDASQAAWEPGRAVDASLLGPPTPPGPPAEVGWLLALAVLCAARLGRGRARADRLRPDLALVRARRSERSAPCRARPAQRARGGPTGAGAARRRRWRQRGPSAARPRSWAGATRRRARPRPPSGWASRGGAPMRASASAPSRTPPCRRAAAARLRQAMGAHCLANSAHSGHRRPPAAESLPHVAAFSVQELQGSRLGRPSARPPQAAAARQAERARAAAEAKRAAFEADEAALAAELEQRTQAERRVLAEAAERARAALEERRRRAARPHASAATGSVHGLPLGALAECAMSSDTAWLVCVSRGHGRAMERPGRRERRLRVSAGRQTKRAGAWRLSARARRPRRRRSRRPRHGSARRSAPSCAACSSALRRASRAASTCPGPQRRGTPTALGSRPASERLLHRLPKSSLRPRSCASHPVSCLPSVRSAGWQRSPTV